MHRMKFLGPLVLGATLPACGSQAIGAEGEPTARRLDEAGCLALVEKHDRFTHKKLGFAYAEFDVEILRRCDMASDAEDIEVQQCLTQAENLETMEACIPSFSRGLTQREQ